MFEVTLKELRVNEACIDGYNKLVCYLSGKHFDRDRETYIHFRYEKPISILQILESNGFDNTLWALQCVKGHDRDLLMYKVWCARQVEHLSGDPRVKACNDVSERFANGEATEEDLAAAWATASAAARVAGAAGDAGAAAAAWAAWGAAGGAGDAVWGARDAALDTALATARAAAIVAGVARDARDAAWAASRAEGGAAANAAAAAALDDQKQMLIKMCKGDAPWQQ